MAMNSMPSVRLISLDLGTSAIKGVVTDVRVWCWPRPGRTPALYTPGGWVEVEPQQHYRNACSVDSAGNQ